jgi:hypothetical protein
MLGAAGPEIMYCGDHLYADVVRQEVLKSSWWLSHSTVIPLQNFILNRQPQLICIPVLFATPDDVSCSYCNLIPIHALVDAIWQCFPEQKVLDDVFFGRCCVPLAKAPL